MRKSKKKEGKDMSEKIWSYFDKYDIVLPEKLADNIIEFPENVCLVKLMPKPEKLPANIISNCLMNANDLKIFERALVSDNLNCPEMANANFWSHVITLVSSSTDNENFESGCSIQLLNRFRFYFEKFVSLANFNKVFQDMVMDTYPPNERGSNFIVSLFFNLHYTYRNSHFYPRITDSFNNKIFQTKKIPPPSFCKLMYIYVYNIDIEKYYRIKISN